MSKSLECQLLESILSIEGGVSVWQRRRRESESELKYAVYTDNFDPKRVFAALSFVFSLNSEYLYFEFVCQ